ncbi:MAG TPA: hypothetical protein VIN38_00765 [Thiobacillus sp.]
MVSAAGSPPLSVPAYTTGASTTGIEAQISRYKQELSACVNCASADTTEGKAAIEAVANKISQAEARIEQAATTDLARLHDTSTQSTPHEQADIASQSKDREDNFLYSSSITPARADPITGSRIDVFV